MFNKKVSQLKQSTKMQVKTTGQTTGKTTSCETDSTDQVAAVALEQLVQAQEKEKRAIADYQNLLRRTRDERLQLLNMANRDFLFSLIEPLENLQKSANQLGDQGLNMVMEQFRQVFDQLNIEIIDPMGKNFDLETMEVIDKKNKGKKVIEVIQRCYKLNGQVAAHAKVVLD